MRKVVLFIFILLLGSFSYFYYQKIYKAGKQAMQAAPTPQVMEIGAIKIETANHEITQEWPARISASRIADIRPQITGVIVKRFFTEGSFVKKGEALYLIDPAEKVKIRAPISGFIGRSIATEGALVTQNQATVLATITQLNPIYIDIVQPSHANDEIKDQKNVSVSISINGTEYKKRGRLKYTEVTVDQTTDSITLRAEIENPNGELMPGMFVNATLHLGSQRLIAVPQRVVDYMPDGSMFVWTVSEDGSIAQTPLQIKEPIGNNWIVEKGLKDGDIVIAEGLQKIRPGMKVQPKIITNDDLKKA